MVVSNSAAALPDPISFSHPGNGLFLLSGKRKHAKKVVIQRVLTRRETGIDIDNFITDFRLL